MSKINSSMRGDIKKIIQVLFFWALAILAFWEIDRENKITMNIKANGVEARAKVVECHYAKGWFANIEYYYNGMKYAQKIGVPDFTPVTGDSLLIKFLPNDLGAEKEIRVEEKIYSVPSN